MNLLFVVPDLGGHPSGGTLYNAALLRELSSLGFDVEVCEPSAFTTHLEKSPGWVWIDSLYLPELKSLFARARAAGNPRMGIVLHYLPTLVNRADARACDLDSNEAFALAESDALLLTGEFMQNRVIEFGYSRERCGLVEPGSDFVLHDDDTPLDGAGVRALMVAHVVPGKGILEFLTCLAGHLAEADVISLSIAGDLGVDAAYAERCRSLVATRPALLHRVSFLGLCSRLRLRDELWRHNLFISASRMEAYGMALSEARSAGLPILARGGGNAAQHVAAAFGSELVRTDEELAARCVALARDPVEHRARRVLARKNVYVPRAWSLVAREFALRLAGFEALAVRS